MSSVEGVGGRYVLAVFLGAAAAAVALLRLRRGPRAELPPGYHAAVSAVQFTTAAAASTVVTRPPRPRVALSREGGIVERDGGDGGELSDDADAAARSGAVGPAREQRAVMDFLRDERTWGGQRVKEVQTDASVVLLVGDLAFKLKRAVKREYLDFTTVARRKAMCRREVEVNQLGAPRLYLGARAIRFNSVSGALSLSHVVWPIPDDEAVLLGPSDVVVDWLVVMRRFSQEGLFSSLVQQPSMKRRTMVDLGIILAIVHASAPVADGWSNASETASVALSNVGALHRWPDLFPASNVTQLYFQTQSVVASLAGLMERRCHDGFVRECHGDLRLRNICLFEGLPVPFDAVEYNQAISNIDVVHDLATLLVDLHFHCDLMLANAVLNGYMQQSADFNGLRLLPLFLAMTAAARARVLATDAVEASRAAITDPTAVESAERFRKGAWRYFGMAVQYLRPVQPQLVAVGGYSGTGKSSLAAAVAPRLGAAPGAVVLRSDVVRKEIGHVAEFSRLPPSSGYTASMTLQVYEEIARRAKIALQAGHSVVADCVFSKAWQRELVRAAGAEVERSTECSTPIFRGIWLEASAMTMMTRVQFRHSDASDATPEIVALQLQSDAGDISGWHVLHTDDANIPDVVQAVERYPLCDTLAI